MLPAKRNHSNTLQGLYNCTYNVKMKIIYDPDKAKLNPINHEGVTFEEAGTVLLDSFAVTKEDSREYDEQRFITLGMSSQTRVLIVVWTMQEDTIRLISSWKATPMQRKHYERQF
jgi:uncharacterized DUF497 family protein